MSLALEDVLEAYVAAWGEPDAEKRMALLEKCWSADATYMDPNSKAQGREALSTVIGGFHTSMPGARIALTSKAAEHNGQIYFKWHLLTPEGDVAITGVDFGSLGEDGRLTRIVGFFGDPPAL